jgi:hypothetical protein
MKVRSVDFLIQSFGEMVGDAPTAVAIQPITFQVKVDAPVYMSAAAAKGNLP